jgi:hypothetical protein
MSSAISRWEPDDMSEPLKSAMGAMDDYLAGLNRGDEQAVNDACNFPHVRLAGGKVAVWHNHGDYKLDDFVARAGDGWHHSTWDERTPIHVGDRKVHLKVKFSRWRKDGSLLGEFETIYIVTLQDGHWGIQARSSFAS